MSLSPDNDGDVLHRLTNVIVELAQDIWRLQSTASRLKQAGEGYPDALAALVERLSEDLTIAGVELIDPAGQRYDKNSTFEIAYLASGKGDLFISETVTPGVRIAGKLVVKPRVVLEARTQGT